MTTSKLAELKKAVNLERLNDGDVITLIECLELAVENLDKYKDMVWRYHGTDTKEQKFAAATALAEIESKLGGV